MPPTAFPAGDAAGEPAEAMGGCTNASDKRTHALGLLRSEDSVRGRGAITGCASAAAAVFAAVNGSAASFLGGLATAFVSADLPLSALPACQPTSCCCTNLLEGPYMCCASASDKAQACDSKSMAANHAITAKASRF
jgi:hypothetical protein